jgi:hypothetical protein
MINKAQDGKRVSAYLFIDRMCEGVGYTKPEEGETLTFWFDFRNDSHRSWVVHRKNGAVTRMVNTDDLAVIEFADSSDQPQEVRR